MIGATRRFPMTTRRFPPPWRAEKMPGGYVVRDANDQALAYVYSRANEAEAPSANFHLGSCRVANRESPRE
jgi:hypothetical protein